MAVTKKNKITLFNLTSMPVVYTDDGRIIAASERIEVDAVDATGEMVIKHGYLIDETAEKAEREAKANKASAGNDGAPAPGKPA